MNTISYKENITGLINKNVINKDDYFDYEYSDEKEVYDLVYQYCQSFLDLMSVEYRITPAKIYYINDRRINACAYKKNGYFLIGINCGTIHYQYSFYHNKKDIFKNTEFEKYANAILNIGGKVEDFQTIVFYQFIFHHEVAHLIQKNDETDFTYQEYTSDNKESNNNYLMRHVLEFDSDCLASSKIVFYVLDSLKGEENKPLSEENLKLITIISITGIISYFINSNNNKAMYFEQTNHPHNFIRLIYITEVILQVITHNTGIRLNSNEILVETLKLVNVFFADEEYNPYNSFTEFYLKDKEQIISYINKINEESKTYDNLALKKLHSINM